MLAPTSRKADAVVGFLSSPSPEEGPSTAGKEEANVARKVSKPLRLPVACVPHALRGHALELHLDSTVDTLIGIWQDRHPDGRCRAKRGADATADVSTHLRQ